MKLNRRITTSIAIALGLLLLATIAPADDPASCQLKGVERIKQITNYCGPAVLASVMRFHGKNITQEAIGKEVYDAASGATNGADMLYYARQAGFHAYTWNSNLQDAKRKLLAGIPVIALQQNSPTDVSGHYRVLTGFDDVLGQFTVMDPYYDSIKTLSYDQCERLWRTMGYWSLAVIPADKDKFAAELDEKNPVVHMDLSQALFKRKDYENATKEAKRALELEPGNQFALSMLGKIKGASGNMKKK